MAEQQFNIENLTLDDNSFKTVPDGDYHFTVKEHEIGYATWDKVPANTQQITLTLEVPVIGEDGGLETVEVTKDLYLTKKYLFVIRQFAEATRMVPEQGKFNVDLTKIDGLEGVCQVSTQESSKGNEYNRVERFYAPSKVPAITANDQAWAAYKDADGFMNIVADVEPPFV